MTDEAPPPATPGSVPVASLVLCAVALALGTASAVSTSRWVAPRFGLGLASVETVYSLAAPLVALALPLLLLRQRRREAWPFRAPAPWTAASAVPWGAALAGATVGLYAGFFKHLHWNGGSWSLGITWFLLAPLCVLLIVLVAVAPWRSLLAALLFSACFELGSTLGLHLGSRPQELSLSEPTIVIGHGALLVTALATGVRHVRGLPEERRARRSAALVVGVLALAALSAVTMGALMRRFSGPNRYWRRLGAEVVEPRVLPWVRGDLARALPATWDAREGWSPARREGLVAAVGTGVVAVRVGETDWDEKLEVVHELDGSRPHALPEPVVEVLLEPIDEAPRRNVLLWSGVGRYFWGRLFRDQDGYSRGEVEGFHYATMLDMAPSPDHIVLKVWGQLAGPDGTRYRVRLLWLHHQPPGPQGPAIDAIAPR